jgi:prolyl oligopeptidase
MSELKKPYYYREIIEGGHGSGADLKQTAATDAVEYLYLMRKLMD